MNLRDKKGSISIFVLVALLFMASVLLLMFASSVNKSKIVKEQFNTISGIYTYDDVDAYNKAYTELREKNKTNMTATNEAQEDKSILELTKTYAEDIINLKIYGNTVEESSVGDSVNGEIKIIIKITDKNATESLTIEIPLINSITNADYIELKKEGVFINGSIYELSGEVALENLKTFEDYTKIEVLTEVKPSKIAVEYQGYTLD